MSRLIGDQYAADAVAHLEYLQLLGEVAEYLGRLPVNAITHSMKRKIEDHLQRPGASLHKVRIEQAGKDQLWRDRLEAGACYTGSYRFSPEGLPVLDCLVVGGNLHLRSPALTQEIGEETDPKPTPLVVSLGREVAEGIDIKLDQINSGTSKFVSRIWPKHQHQFK